MERYDGLFKGTRTVFKERFLKKKLSKAHYKFTEENYRGSSCLNLGSFFELYLFLLLSYGKLT